MSNQYKIETKCIQSGWKPKKGGQSLARFESTTFKYDTTDEMGKLFDLEEEGYFYTRLQNPTNDAVAGKDSDLEGGVAAVLTLLDRRQTSMLFNICEAGDHIVCAAAISETFDSDDEEIELTALFVDADHEEEIASIPSKYKGIIC